MDLKEMFMMKAFVTGATGHIGNVLVRELYRQGWVVTALSLPKERIDYIEPYATVVEGNILDLEQMKALIRDVDVCFHLAGMVEIGAGKKKTLYRVNVDGTKNVYEACRINHIPRMVYTSSVHALQELPHGALMAESNQFSPDLVKGHYAKSKAIATGWLLERPLEGTEIIIVHPSGVIGPYDYQLSNMSQLFLDMLMGRLRAYIDGGYNFVDVRDVAIGIVSAANRGIDRRCYLLSGDQISVKELLDTISIHEGIKPVKTRLAYGFMRSMSYFAEAYYRLARQKPLFTHYSIVVLRSNANFSNERAKKELGFETRNILQSIRDSIDFARAEFLVKRGKKYIRKI